MLEHGVTGEGLSAVRLWRVEGLSAVRAWRGMWCLSAVRALRGGVYQLLEDGVAGGGGYQLLEHDMAGGGGSISC
jgi:hypothetical protein